MHPAFLALLAAELSTLVSVPVMALLARSLGIEVLTVQLGGSPIVLRRGVFRLGALPFSGFVKMSDSRSEPLDQAQRLQAFNYQAPWKQIVVPLSGALSLLLIGLAALGKAGWGSFLAAFGQVALGAMEPLSTAQGYLDNFGAYARQHGTVATLALALVKLAAFNLLPLPPLNGGQVLLNLVRWRQPELHWENQLVQWTGNAMIILILLWLVALGDWVWRSL